MIFTTATRVMTFPGPLCFVMFDNFQTIDRFCASIRSNVVSKNRIMSLLVDRMKDRTSMSVAP